VFAVRMLSVLVGHRRRDRAWGLARELFGDRVGADGSGVCRRFAFLIAYSQEARMYARVVLERGLAMGFCAGGATGGLGVWIAMTLCGALALYSHNLGFLTLRRLAYLSSRGDGQPSTERREHWKLAAQTALAGLVMAILFSPWLAFGAEPVGQD